MPLTRGKTITIHHTGYDRWQRLLAFVEADGMIVNAELIKRGLAWHSKEYSDDTELAELENNARRERMGLWADKKPIEPWEWRKQK